MQSLCEYRRYLNNHLVIRAIDPVVNPSRRAFVSQDATAYPNFELCKRTYVPLCTPPFERSTRIPLFTLTIWMKYIPLWALGDMIAKVPNGQTSHRSFNVPRACGWQTNRPSILRIYVTKLSVIRSFISVSFGLILLTIVNLFLQIPQFTLILIYILVSVVWMNAKLWPNSRLGYLHQAAMKLRIIRCLTSVNYSLIDSQMLLKWLPIRTHSLPKL